MGFLGAGELRPDSKMFMDDTGSVRAPFWGPDQPEIWFCPSADFSDDVALTYRKPLRFGCIGFRRSANLPSIKGPRRPYDGLIQIKIHLDQSLREPRRGANLPRIALAATISVFVRGDESRTSVLCKEGTWQHRVPKGARSDPLDVRKKTID